MHDSTEPRLFLAFSRIGALSPSLLAALSHDERQRAETLASAKRRSEFVWGRSLLRQLLREATGVPAESHVISTTDAGKPVCHGGPGVSISHTNGTVVCAVSLAGDVGIDIEVADAHRETKQLATQYFSSVENDWLDTQPEESFYALWVLKEAYLKALGSGLAGGLDRIQCRIEPPCLEAVIGASATCRLALFELPGAYLGLATTDLQSDEICITRWNPSLDRLAEASWLERIASGVARPNSTLQRQ